MKDMQLHLDKLRMPAAECEMISSLATDKTKRELFAKLAQHFKVLAAEVERAMPSTEALIDNGYKQGDEPPR